MRSDRKSFSACEYEHTLIPYTTFYVPTLICVAADNHDGRLLECRKKIFLFPEDIKFEYK